MATPWLRTDQFEIVNSRFFMDARMEKRGPKWCVVLTRHDDVECVMTFEHEGPAVELFEEFAAVLTNQLINEMLGG